MLVGPAPPEVLRGPAKGPWRPIGPFREVDWIVGAIVAAVVVSAIVRQVLARPWRRRGPGDRDELERASARNSSTSRRARIIDRDRPEGSPDPETEARPMPLTVELGRSPLTDLRALASSAAFHGVLLLLLAAGVPGGPALGGRGREPPGLVGELGPVDNRRLGRQPRRRAGGARRHADARADGAALGGPGRRRAGLDQPRRRGRRAGRPDPRPAGRRRPLGRAAAPALDARHRRPARPRHRRRGRRGGRLRRRQGGGDRRRHRVLRRQGAGRRRSPM